MRNRTFVTSSVSILFFSLAFYAGISQVLADENTERPCRELVKLCKDEGGFVSGDSGGTPGKSVINDCVKPLLAGQTVAGIKANDQLNALVASCKARKEDPKRKEQREERKKKRLEAEQAGGA